MIVVLEGPDGVGKTTLADALESAWATGKTIRFRQGPPPDGTLAAMHYQDGLDEMASKSKTDTLVIADRFHVGELVYGPLLRGESGITMGEAAAIDKMLDGENAMLIHCHLDRHEMMRRLVDRDGGIPDEKSGAKLDHAYAIRAAFQHKIGRPGQTGALPGKWWVEDMTWYPDQLADRIITSARMSGRMSAPRTNWIGPLDASTIFCMYHEDCKSTIHLAWCLENIALISAELTNDCAFVFPSTNFKGIDMSHRHVIAMGEMDWLEQRGIVADAIISHGPDHHEYDVGEDWRYSVKSAFGLGRTDDTGTPDNGRVEYA